MTTIIDEVNPSGVGMFEIDVNGGLMPSDAVYTDTNWELDASGDIMPL